MFRDTFDNTLADGSFPERREKLRRDARGPVLDRRAGQRVGVLLNLKQWGELWEDIYDSMMALERRREPSMPLEEFEAELRAEAMINEYR